MTPASADEKRLAQYRADTASCPHHAACMCGMCVACRLLDASQARRAEVKRERDKWRKVAGETADEFAAAEERASALAASLEHYADHGNWGYIGSNADGGPSCANEYMSHGDGWTVAKQALARSTPATDAKT